MPNWTRPSSVPVPTVWATFQGKKEINGVKRTYWIQDITDEYKDEVVKYMVKYFITDEPLSRYSNVYDSLRGSDLIKLEEESWYEGLKCNLGLVCLTKDENGKPTIAAMNCTTISHIDDEESSETGHQVLDTLTWMKKQIDVFKTLNITEYLSAMGLYVLPEYRGEGLGLEVLKAREPLCRACGITTSITLFTSMISQKLAERAGFQDLCAMDYDEIERRNPQFSYPGIQSHTKSLRLMYITYK